MRHLVDAHSLIWALDDPRKLGIRAVAVLEDPPASCSSVSEPSGNSPSKEGWESSLCPCRTAHGWKKP